MIKGEKVRGRGYLVAAATCDELKEFVFTTSYRKARRYVGRIIRRKTATRIYLNRISGRGGSIPVKHLQIHIP